MFKLALTGPLCDIQSAVPQMDSVDRQWPDSMVWTLHLGVSQVMWERHKKNHEADIRQERNDR